ncbi:MAG: tetratricopeptide repeat protein, partial [Acidobacteria bacterium]|nr:tetratricopeptide repeat protein [Acidobacteriota bacterium]
MPSSINPSSRPRRAAWLIPAVIAVVIFSGSLASNLLANDLHPWLGKYRLLYWLLVGGVVAIALVVSIFIAVREARSSNDPIQGSPSRPATSQPTPQEAERKNDEAAPVESRRIFDLPITRNKYFTGREEFLKQLHQRFADGENVQAINGLGGIGKTQTAVEYAYRHCHDYQVMLLTNASSHETLVADFMEMARQLCLPEKNAEDHGLIVRAVKRWFEKNSGWLLIFDNADDLTIVREFIPRRETGHVLLTTRDHTGGTIAVENELEKMSPQEGAIFLLRRINKKDKAPEFADAEHNKAEAVSIELGGLPLAVDQAAAFIVETPSTLDEYLHLYQSKRAELLSRRGELVSDHPDSVTITFSLAFEKVAAVDPVAADLLRLCTFLEAESIPEEIFSEGASDLGEAIYTAAATPGNLVKAIGRAGRYSLLRRSPKARTVSFHRLAQTVLRDGMDSDEKRMWAERAVRAVNKAFPNVEYSQWTLCSRLVPHVQTLVLFINEFEFEFPEAARMMDQAGLYLYYRARYAEAESLLKRALEIREKALGPEHLDTSTSLTNLAKCYR